MGARLEDYTALAPPNSFIHVDQFSGPAELAAHLHLLGRDHDSYNAHLAWVDQGSIADTKATYSYCNRLLAGRVGSVSLWQRSAELLSVAVKVLSSCCAGFVDCCITPSPRPPSQTWTSGGTPPRPAPPGPGHTHTIPVNILTAAQHINVDYGTARHCKY